MFFYSTLQKRLLTSFVCCCDVWLQAEVQLALSKQKVAHEKLPSGRIGFKVSYNDKDCVFSTTEIMAMYFGNLKDIVGGERAINNQHQCV